jgi:hypothetical protein
VKRVVLVVLSVACGGGADVGGTEPPRLRATVGQPYDDTVRFAVPAVARRCADGRSVLLEGAGERGDGVLVLLRAGDSLNPTPSGSFSLLTFGDSTTPRGARVSVRYMTHDVAHGFTLDSGVVEVTVRGAALGARVHGTGRDGGTRASLDAEYTGVSFAPAAVSCR